VAQQEHLLTGIFLVRGTDYLMDVGLDVPPVVELAARDSVVDVRGCATPMATIVEAVDAVASVGKALS